jgi:hypothetical protein
VTIRDTNDALNLEWGEGLMGGATRSIRTTSVRGFLPWLKILIRPLTIEKFD